MLTLKLVQKITLLLRYLQREVLEFIDKLIQNNSSNDSDQPKDVNSELPVIWSKEPDVAALFGLRKNDPIDLKNIRKKAWSRKNWNH